jgi:hypothetical protein
MADALRRGLGQSAELERELAFRRILTTRNSGLMAARYLQGKSTLERYNRQLKMKRECSYAAQ